MNSEQIEHMKQSGMLFLDKERRKSHFDGANLLKWSALIPAALFLYFLIKNGLDGFGFMVLIFGIMASIFLLAGYLIHKSQEKKLKLTTIYTGMKKDVNYMIAKATFDALQWPLSEDSPDFIEAYNPHRDIRTWGKEMVSVLPLHNQIMINSICNLEEMNQIAFSFGKNKQNVEKFIEYFELIAQNKKQQSA